MYLKKNEIINKIFYLTIVIYFLFSAMTVTMIESHDSIALIAKLIRYVCYVFLVFVIICNIINFKKQITIKNVLSDFMDYFKKHLILILVLLNTVGILLSTSVRAPLIMVLLIWACSFYDFNRIIKVYFNVLLYFMFTTWGLSILKLIQEVIIWRGERQRFSIGFIYPLETMTFFLFLVICYVYIKNKDFNMKDFGAVNVVAALLYVVTDARTSYYLVIAVTVVALLYSRTKLENILKKISFKMYALIPIVCAGISIAGGLFFDKENEIWLKLDTAVSGRLNLTSNAFKTYGFSLFGENIEWIGFGKNSDQSLVAEMYNFVDCAYARVLLDYGILFAIVVLIGYIFIYKWAIQNQEYRLVIVISVVLAVSIMEPRLISIEMNPFLLLLSHFIMQENRSKFRFMKE